LTRRANHWHSDIIAKIVKSPRGEICRGLFRHKASAARGPPVGGTIPGESTGTFWGTGNTSNTIGTLFFVGYDGSTYQTTPNAWQNGNFNATPSITNFFASNNNVLCITGVVVVPGKEAPSAERSAFIQRRYNPDLKLAQRYYEKRFNVNTMPVQNIGLITAGAPHGRSRSGRLRTRSWHRSNSWSASVPLRPSFFTTRVRRTPKPIVPAASSGTSVFTNGECGFAIAGITPAGSAQGQTGHVNWTADAWVSPLARVVTTAVSRFWYPKTTQNLPTQNRRWTGQGYRHAISIRRSR
jgi:hypothetical protein